MKHLKAFESYGKNKSIDWDFISDAKEQALDLIDDGWTFAWGVECLMPDRSYTIVSGLYDHNQDTTEWSYDFNKEQVFEEDELVYQFYFSRTEGLDMSTIRGILNKEFKNKLREMYPSKEII